MDGSERIGSRLGIMHAAHGPHALNGQAIVIGQSMDFCNKTVAAWSVTSTQLTFLQWQPNDERAIIATDFTAPCGTPWIRNL